MVQTFESMGIIVHCDYSKVKAIEQCFSVALSVMLYKMVQTFESVNEIVRYEHSNESY